MQPRRFEGRKAIVTGASSGIGAAVTRMLVQEGAVVAAAARSAARLEALASSLARQGRVVPVAVDLAAPSSPSLLVDRAADALGGIDMLVNSAGVNFRGPIDHFRAEQLASIVQLNLLTPILLARLVLPHMRHAGGGAIVNVASLAGRVPVVGEAVYSATKFGLRVFTFALAEELAHEGVRVAVVSPGPVDTGFIMDRVQEVPDLVFSQSMSTADDVARSILDLAIAGGVERVMPRSAAFTTTMAYVFPALRRWLSPLFERRGRANKQRMASRGPVTSC